MRAGGGGEGLFFVASRLMLEETGGVEENVESDRAMASRKAVASRWVPRTVVASRVAVPHPAWLEPKLSVTQSPFGGGRRPGRDHIEKAPKVVAVSTMASALETSSSA